MDRPVTTHDPIDDAIGALLADWLPGRRWFPVKGARADLTVVGGLSLTDPLGEAFVRILLVRAVAPGITTLVQVPVTIRPVRDPARADGSSAPTLIGPAPEHGFELHDACGDPAFLRAWLAAAQGPGSSADPVRARVLTSEQSNTSVILPARADAADRTSDTRPDGPDSAEHGTGSPRAAILKVFRVPSPGANPDVDVPRALTSTGWGHVPRPLAWLEASWPDGDTLVSGHLGVLSEFVADAQDGFELACQMAGSGEPFGDLARELGAVVAGMHTALREALPVGATTRVDAPVDEATPGEAPVHEPHTQGAQAVASAVRERFRWARSLVPALDDLASLVEAFAAGVETLTDVPAPQRIHGDLHLGQVLRAHGTWVVTDFEGEPLAPIAARTRPDLALRDVAGMLRSFDYAAAVGQATSAGWAEEARRALLDGYLAAATDHLPGAPGGQDVRAQLLRALELDKALYEAVYEARNRPDWLAIPLGALTRLVGQPPTDGTRS